MIINIYNLCLFLKHALQIINEHANKYFEIYHFISIFFNLLSVLFLNKIFVIYLILPD